jgi:hypothetical protein
LTEEEHARTLRWIDNWKRTAPVLDALRRKAIEDANTQEFVEAMDGMLESIFRENKPRLTTGLVEQQRCFAMMRK